MDFGGDMKAYACFNVCLRVSNVGCSEVGLAKMFDFAGSPLYGV